MALALVACSAATMLDPDAGNIRFGTSVNMQSFELSGQRTTFRSGGDVAYRAALSSVLRSGQFRLVGTLNGTAVLDSVYPVEEASLYVGTIPAAYLFEPGTFRLEIRDIGNNVLSVGSFTVV